tara:strand:+ start:147 stop:1082 length:936 start_codon:yes stop_codon:yes gene_type:complete
MKVPTIDLQNPDLGQLKSLDAACRDHGFFLLKNHGIGDAITQMWDASNWFFNQPRGDKLNILRTEQNPLGYYDRELTKRQRDLKEVFDFIEPKPDEEDINQWPQDKSFKDAMESFFQSASIIAEKTLDLVFKALVADLDSINTPTGDAHNSTVRLNYYPVGDPLSIIEQKEVNKLGDMALHHHTDPNILTLLLQDMTGGLQTKSSEEGWINVPPAEDTIVVNLGDTMQVWTNDQYVAALHRVIPRTKLVRYSTPYFYNPLREAILEPINGFSEEKSKYRTFAWKDYIRGRIEDNYFDLGEDDIQIERFRIA